MKIFLGKQLNMHVHLNTRGNQRKSFVLQH